jgi:hypothetical protein
MSKTQANHANELNMRLKKAGAPVGLNALAIGVDVTWWGGSGKASEANSRKECVAFAVKTKTGWSLPEFKRVELTRFDSEAEPTVPNADPDGRDLVSELKKAIERHKGVTSVVIALDAPLMSVERDLPPRRKAQRVGEVERRACDREWAKSVSLSPAGWRAINIQPGSPIPPRISDVVAHLKAENFGLYTESEAKPEQRTLIECFPNEVIWSAGILGSPRRASFASMVGYKVMGKHKTALPCDILETVCAHTLLPCLDVAGLNSERWLTAFWSWLSSDQFFKSGVEGVGVTGKCFDDAIDSMLSLIAAVAFIDGHAHVHQGSDPLDGHIIGPGLPTERVSDPSPSSHSP